MLSRRYRIILLGVLFGFVTIKLPENNFEIFAIVSLVISVSYDAWWTGIESEREQ